MAADCEQTRSLMLELLYGDLTASTRAEVEAHVASCPDCRTELAALESTRSLARQALAADAPPARARATILRAATAAIPVLPVPAPARPSLWGWMRGKWTLPTFATVGAVAIFLLASRIFLEPEKTYERGRQGLSPAVEVTAAPPTAGAPSAPPVTARAIAGGEDLEPPAASNAPAAKPAAPHKHRATASAGKGRGAVAESSGALYDRLDLDKRAAPAAEPARKASKKESSDDLLEGLNSAESERDGAGAAPRARAEAPPPPPAAPAAAAAPAPVAASPAPPPAARRHETLPARAERLFAEKRWVEAAAAYRDLLRADPGNPAAVQWRQRLAACQAAAAAEAR